MPQFNINLRKNEDGTRDLSRLQVTLPDGSEGKIEKDEKGNISVSWTGDAATVAAAVDHLKSLFPNLGDIFPGYGFETRKEDEDDKLDT